MVSKSQFAGFASRLPIVWVQALAGVAVVITSPLHRPVDPDYWWHFETGRRVLSDGIPRHDPYSWTRAGDDWVAHEWLAEALIYLLDAVGGYAVNLLVFGLLTALALMLTWHAARREGLGARVSIVLLVLAVAQAAPFVAVRPQAFTWLLFACFLLVLWRHDRRLDGPLWLLPPLMALWANLHLGFTFGLMLLGVWLAALAWRRLRGEAVPLAKPATVAVACLLASLLNPEGPEILLYPFRYYQDREALQHIAEWQRPVPYLPQYWAYFISAALLAWCLTVKERPGPFGCLVALLVVAMGFAAGRNMVFVGIALPLVAGPVLARRFQWARRDRDARTALRLPVAAVLVAGAAVLVAAMGAARTGGGLSLREPSEASYPAAAAKYIRDNALGTRMFNEYDWGGYLVYKLQPDVPVFIDGRSDLYRKQLMLDYLDMREAEGDWQSLLDSYGVEVVLVRDDAPLARALADTAGWEELFAGDDSIVIGREERIDVR